MDEEEGANILANKRALSRRLMAIISSTPSCPAAVAAAADGGGARHSCELAAVDRKGTRAILPFG